MEHKLNENEMLSNKTDISIHTLIGWLDVIRTLSKRHSKGNRGNQCHLHYLIFSDKCHLLSRSHPIMLCKYWNQIYNHFEFRGWIIFNHILINIQNIIINGNMCLVTALYDTHHNICINLHTILNRTISQIPNPRLNVFHISSGGQ